MRKDFEKLFTHLEPPQPPAGLFDRIILAIRQERESRQTRKLLCGFLFLLAVSLVATPFSFAALASEMADSGIIYFVSTAISDFGVFFALWQDFGLAILESLPIVNMAAFAISMGITLFTFRLFLHRKRLLWGYLIHNFN